MNQTTKQLNFKSRKHFYKYILESPTELSTDDYQQIYKNLSDNKQTKLNKKYNYLLSDFSKTGILQTTIFLLDSNGKKIRQHLISSIEGVQERLHKKMLQKYNNIKKLFSREDIDDIYLLNSFFLFLENNKIHKKGKSIKKLLLKFLSAYDHKNKSIDTNKLNLLFSGVEFPMCSDFIVKYYDGETINKGNKQINILKGIKPATTIKDTQGKNIIEYHKNLLRRWKAIC